MVDAARTVLPTSGAARPSHASLPGGWTVRVVPADAAALARYETFCADSRFAAPQHPSFVRNWIESHGADALMVETEWQGRAVAALPLVVEKSGLFTIARLPGGRHANASFPALARFDTMLDPALALRPVADLRPDIDLVLLERLEPIRFGRDNPFASSATATPSPNPALSVDLSGGFDALMERVSGKRKRKKHRSQSRKFEAAGGYRIFRASTSEEVDAVLSAFFAMKEERFRRMGISDVFADPRVRSFFRALFTDALAETTPSFVLETLEVDGVVRAVTGSSASGDRLTCEFGAIREDELAATSPGDFLFFENIRAACEAGFASYDFGVGDEPYKRLWCDVETHHFDLAVPLTARGRLLALSRRGAAAAKREIKQNPALWSMAKRLRRFVGGRRDDETPQQRDAD